MWHWYSKTYFSLDSNEVLFVSFAAAGVTFLKLVDATPIMIAYEENQFSKEGGGHFAPNLFYGIDHNYGLDSLADV